MSKASLLTLFQYAKHALANVLRTNAPCVRGKNAPRFSRGVFAASLTVTVTGAVLIEFKCPVICRSIIHNTIVLVSITRKVCSMSEMATKVSACFRYLCAHMHVIVHLPHHSALRHIKCLTFVHIIRIHQCTCICAVGFLCVHDHRMHDHRMI
jgi:hypothetical protein